MKIKVSRTHTIAGPPRRQRSIKLEDGYDRAVNQDTELSTKNIPTPPVKSVPPI